MEVLDLPKVRARVRFPLPAQNMINPERKIDWADINVRLNIAGALVLIVFLFIAWRVAA